MTGTPARDAWADYGTATARSVREAAIASGCCGTPEWRGHLCQYHQGVEDGMDSALHVISPNLVVAALIESGWRPTDDQLRAMGGLFDGLDEEVEGGWWAFPRTEETTDGEG